MFTMNIIHKNLRRSRHWQHKHVAVLTRGGAIVAIGTNHDTIHAEVAAMNQIWPNKRSGLTLWSFRMTKAGQLAMALPCSKCQEILYKNGITKIHYSDQSGQMRSIRLWLTNSSL